MPAPPGLQVNAVMKILSDDGQVVPYRALVAIDPTFPSFLTFLCNTRRLLDIIRLYTMVVGQAALPVLWVWRTGKAACPTTMLGQARSGSC